jgi:hypothetical protein
MPAAPASTAPQVSERSQAESIDELLRLVEAARSENGDNERRFRQSQESQRETSFRNDVSNEAEEVVVTGSRIVTAQSPAIAGIRAPTPETGVTMDDVEVSASTTDSDLVLGPGFRMNPETWAEEIYYLSQEASDLNTMLEEETRLFQQRFPETDLGQLVDQVEQEVNE